MYCNDQIVKILERFPEVEPSTDFSYANGDKESIEYLESNLIHCDSKKQSLNKKLSGSNPTFIEIITDMLQINPYFRPSAFELL